MTWLGRFLTRFRSHSSVLHRFDPAECRERQRQAAITAAFYPQPGPRLTRGPQDRGFQ